MTLRRALARAWRILRDPGRYSAERYASSSVMYHSALRPETWRRDLGPEHAPDIGRPPDPDKGPAPK